MKNMNKEQQHTNSVCKIKANKYFWPELNGKTKKGWCLHHKDPAMRHNDIDRYVQWNIDDVVPMTISDHLSFHKTGNNGLIGHKHSEATKKKMSLNNWRKKHPYTDDERKNISITTKNAMNTSEIKKKCSIGGTMTGKKPYWTNGILNKRQFECPGPGWRRGKTIFT